MSSLNEQRARRKDPPSFVFCGVCTATCTGVAKCGLGWDVPFCSVDCYGIHQTCSCARVLSARPCVGVVLVGSQAVRKSAQSKQDPGWGWSLLNSGVDLEMVSVESRSLSIPSVLVCDFVLVDVGNVNYARLAPVVRRLIVRLVHDFCKFLEFILTSDRKCFFLHRHVSLLWECPAWKDFSGTVGVNVVQSGLQGEVWAVQICMLLS